MESVMSEMDLEEWELVPEEGYLEINNKIYSSRKVSSASTTTTTTTTTTSVFQMNYFICPAADQFVDKTQLLPYNNNNNDLQAAAAAAAATNKQAAAAAAGDQINYVNPPPVPVPDGDAAASSQSVFFKKITKETEFADIMKMDSSPRSMKNPDQSFDHHHHHHHQVDYDDDNSKRNDDDQQQYFNIWKWSLTGIGAICSFGVAAACIITSANKHQNLHFQIYTNDKRMKQVASKLNEAISAVRGGVPVTRAHITFGGYYDASSP